LNKPVQYKSPELFIARTFVRNSHLPSGKITSQQMAHIKLRLLRLFPIFKFRKMASIAS